MNPPTTIDYRTKYLKTASTLLRGLMLAILFFLVLSVFLIPFLWMFFGGLRPEQDIFSHLTPFQWHTIIPAEWTFESFRDVFDAGFGKNLLNSFIVAGATVPLAILFDSMAAFAFAWLKVPFRNLLFGLLLLIMIIPEQSTIIPLYLTVINFDLQDTYWALILPFIARPIGIFTLRQFILELPKELGDAAIVDGASPFQVYWNVVVPNIVPALVTIGLIDFMFAWNQFFWPLIAVQDTGKQMVQVAVATFMNPEITAWSQLFAASTLASLPVITLFLFLQKYYIRGIARTGIKG